MEPLILRGDKPDWIGSGYGYGSGSGYGSGDGSGYGDGSGSGSGSGYGSGSGDGSGDGSGYGSKEYWLSTIQYFAARWPENSRQRLASLQKEGATIAFWKSSADGRACNGGRSTAPVQPGTVETAPGPLACCTAGVLHATFLPPKWKGERMWVVALIGETATQEDKVAALKREVIGECL
jgi:hypothetical protein